MSVVSLKKSTLLVEAMKEYPGLIDFLITISPSYGLLKNGTIVAMMAPRTTMAKIAQRGGLTFDALLEKLNAAEDDLRTSEAPPDDSEQVKAEIVALLRQVTGGADMSALRERFKELLRRADPVTVAAAEAELVKEGYTLQDLMSACELHMEVFRETLAGPPLEVPPDHPLGRLFREQGAILAWFGEAHALVGEARAASDPAARERIASKLRQAMERLNRAVDSHEVRQENTLFPVLEKYGVEEPPSIMWHEHTQMKETRKSAAQWLNDRPVNDWDNDFLTGIDAMLMGVAEAFAQHAQKEQAILYRIALDMLSDKDWQDIKEESDQLGYFELSGEEGTQ
jgi:DUF438 domain-containing protein